MVSGKIQPLRQAEAAAALLLGHAEAVRVSTLGFQYPLSGRAPDPRIKWGRN